MSAPDRIRVAQDADGFWTCREAVSGSQEYVRADLVPLNSKCPHCDGTGDVHRADGEWLGECDCGSEFRHAFDVEASPSKAFRIIQIHTTRIAALEAENARLTKEVEFWQSSDKASSEYIEAMRAARTEASAAVKVKAWTVGAHESDGQTWLTIKMPEGPTAMLSCRSRIECGDETIVSQIVKEFASALSPSTQQEAEAVEPDFAKSIASVIAEESANGAAVGWRSCTGCHETNEGYETGYYPYSKLFGCHVGSGCSECGGLGVVWEYWTAEAIEAMAADDTEQAHPPAPAVTEAIGEWREIETSIPLKGRRKSPAYFPATGETCEVSGPNCDDANGYTWGQTTVLWQNHMFVLYGSEGFWPVLHKHEHVLFRPLAALQAIEVKK